MNGGDNAMNFEEIYRKYFNDVFLYICKLSGDEHISQEITSDTFFKAMSSIKSFRGECDVRVWLCQIAKNCYYTYLKKNKMTMSLNDATYEAVDTCSEIDEDIIQKDETMQIKMILHTIPQPYREVFMWRVFAELNFKQIGQIFNKTDNWACVTYHRAKNMIRERMEEIRNEE